MSARAGRPYALMHLDGKGTCSLPQYSTLDQVLAVLEPEELKRGRCVPCVAHTVVARREDGSWLVKTFKV